jgi:DNA invertase Pin-like site-specific DNA recombinase
MERAGCGKIFREKTSGGNRDRPQFQRMLDQIRVGGTIVVWKLDRLARSTLFIAGAVPAARIR